MSKIRQSARDQECTIRLPGVCNRRTDTTVLCHPNDSLAGKGLGKKADDRHGAYGCFDCHNVVDRRVPRPVHLTRAHIDQFFNDGCEATHQLLKTAGLV